MGNKATFSGDRYATRGIADRIEPTIQMALWQAIEVRKARGDELDYLQVFELSVEMVDGEPLQKVLNRQEQPEHRESFYVDGVQEPIGGVTIWVMDSGTYCTMLFPDEY
ncbi:hypothetical protein H7K32_26695 [Brevibacillus agri]|uniref:DUF960 family protein n=1 Tax=Brevibacillus agri TaxID=51101 RepID=UPI001C8D271E|nr:DUF960 family protein [Brevibacillus agri]MBY0055138.1 hypothetical protein [Brevibacillus agri]